MRKAMLVNRHTYGYFYPDSSVFECTHGAWDGVVTFIDDTTCSISTVSGISSYQWIDKVPEEYGGHDDVNKQ
jgi:hypothetical protein